MTTSATTAATRILFVGNSYTSRNDLPRLVSELAAAAPQPRELHTQAIVAGGASLKRHWNAGKVQAALAATPWDYVVLQEQSTLPFKSSQRYHENVRLFHPEIARHGAKIVLYLTWSRQQTPERQDEITRAVQAIGAEVGALVVPVGPVWHRAMHWDPSLKLYVDDGSHPTAAGSYLAACVFLIALFDQKPSGWSVADKLKLDRGTAESLHVVASDVIRRRG